MGVAITWLRIRRAAVPRPLAPVDAIVVPGAALNEDGSPCRELRERVDTAVALYWQDLARAVLCAGGRSRIGLSETEVMREMLITRGVRPEAVLIDERATSTRRAVAVAAEHAAGRWRRVAFVSSSYHLHRILMEARRQALPATVYPAVAESRRLPLGTPVRAALQLRRAGQRLREVVAVWWYAASSPSRRRQQSPELADVDRRPDGDSLRECPQVDRGHGDAAVR